MEDAMIGFTVIITLLVTRILLPLILLLLIENWPAAPN
jgi:hypothetical protein